MNSHPVLFTMLMVVSLAASMVLWMRILRRPGRFWVKLLFMLLAGIPFFGPVFYLLIDAPDAKSLHQQDKPFAKGTDVHASFAPLITILNRFFGREGNS